ncbi:integrase core domain-containing protein [Ruegeria arenilitoris]
MRREVLNSERFTTTKQAQIVINHWLKQYNYTRPHQASTSSRKLGLDP